SLLNVEEKWHVEAQQNSPRSPIILVGLKLDLRTDPAVINELAAYGQKPVSSEEGERIARSIGAVSYIECSSIWNRNVVDVFMIAASTLLMSAKNNTQQQPPPVHRKIVVVGDGASGKTCALRTFHENQFPEDDSYIPTVFDTCIMDMPWRGHQIELGLWDTAGQEDYDRLRMMSYENTDIVLMCFSVDSIESLENTNEKWLPEIQTQAPNAKVLMQAVFRLILEGLAMFAGSWAAGCIPLYVRMDQSKFNILALFGAGLLIGAALAVILPEGIETLARALLSSNHKNAQQVDEIAESLNNTVGWSLVAGFCTMFLIDNLCGSGHSHSAPDNDSATCLDEIQMTPAGANPGMAASEFTLHSPQNATLDNHHHHHQHDEDDDSVVNTRGAWTEGRQRTKWMQTVRNVLGALSPMSLPSTLIGILVHSCADGLALGAAVAAASSSSSSSSTDTSDDHTSSLELIVFMALLLHKAPAAFGLITTLKQQGFPKYKLSVWLTVFAASAPLAALATYSVVLLIGNHNKNMNSGGIGPWAGTIMLFSAGTFMYVAMAHTLAEAVHQARMLRAKSLAHSSKPVFGALSLVDIVVLLAGVILPPLVSKDHDG
ncbi:hypothetical protein GGF39_003555, partial [Coemansia sp. RSA 1721]